MSASALTFAEAQRIVLQGVRDKSYERLPMGQEAKAYLRVKRKSLSPRSLEEWEVALDKLARYFPHLEIQDFEPPIGTERVEEFMDEYWGRRAPRTYNKNLSIIRDFFKHAIIRGKLHGDPCLPIRPARTQQVYRTTYSEDQCIAIVGSAGELRDRIALRLLLYYGLRRGALQSIQFKHFDHQRRKLTIFTKGGKVRALPLPEPAFWLDLERHILDVEAQPNHYLMCPRKKIPRVGIRFFPADPLGESALRRWWYDRLIAAGIVPEGTTSGERMHKARHTSGQRILDATKGNLKAVQKLLGHASIQTTGDIYTDWDDAQLTATLADALLGDADRDDC